MSEKFSRRDFLKGMAVVTASGLLVACGGGNGTPVKLAFVAMDNFYDQDETLNGYVLFQGFQVKNLSASDITLDGLLDFETYNKEARKVGDERSDPGTGWLLQNDYSQNICRCSDVHCRAGPCFFQNVEAG